MCAMATEMQCVGLSVACVDVWPTLKKFNSHEKKNSKSGHSQSHTYGFYVRCLSPRASSCCLRRYCRQCSVLLDSVTQGGVRRVTSSCNRTCICVLTFEVRYFWRQKQTHFLTKENGTTTSSTRPHTVGYTIESAQLHRSSLWTLLWRLALGPSGARPLPTAHATPPVMRPLLFIFVSRRLHPPMMRGYYRRLR